MNHEFYGHVSCDQNGRGLERCGEWQRKGDGVELMMSSVCVCVCTCVIFVCKEVYYSPTSIIRTPLANFKNFTVRISKNFGYITENGYLCH